MSKLNGERLQELNISTNVILEPTDFVGSGETDGYSMRRPVPPSQAPGAPVARPSAPTPAPIRPNTFQTQHNATLANYNARARAYNAASGTQGYGSSTPNSATYQTPQPPPTTAQPQYLPRAYQSNITPGYNPQATLQAFQRPSQNGYTKYTTGTTNTPSFVQRPSQPGYQQRAQDRDTAALAGYGRSASPQTPAQTAVAAYQNSLYPRSASPQRPITNGQMPAFSPQRSYQTPQQPQRAAAYSPRPSSAYGAVNQTNASANANANANASLGSADTAQRERIDQLKQQLDQRQSSANSPQPQGHPGTNMNAGYDGAADAEHQVKREASTPAANTATMTS